MEAQLPHEGVSLLSQNLSSDGPQTIHFSPSLKLQALCLAPWQT